MSLIYVTGIETAGKTTVCKGLKRHGFEAYDIDEGIAHFYNIRTGARSEWLASAEDRSEAWHQQNEYMMDREHVQRLAQQVHSKHIILCGTTQRDDVVLDLFDKVICLFLDEKRLKDRIAARGAGEFGYAPHEEQAILGWHKTSEGTYRKRGAHMIEASQPVDVVLEEVIEKIK
jgi:broad-specificity NMP kinase